MRSVVAYASAHGSTEGIARRIADTLASPNSSPSSASAPVWAFSVSSVGATSTFLSPRVAKLLRPRTPLARAVAALETAGSLRAHRAFAGAIARGDWPGFGRIVFRLMGGKYGDARDWDDVDRWTRQILADQQSAAPPQDGH
ncbi:hypothetical protein GDN83_09180 [Gordonia jinghuaiqii]|uniref:Flavodoxin domain-containing protein n=1 Tax=Gordonia jinghuaiqii TaxID=2758710 RepID=A0A7D7LY02_9ACTN|nr:flavodoxin domain-containing protein [Gordonia jinghuaiqii]MCR5977901.1 hypothetical protein [Gordonia jinghuaiqii]QMT02559.1 hypothetical protein H1R19_05240 [Gordonia jinghuaiqii]